MGLGESMQSPEGTRVLWFESSAIFCIPSPTMSQPYSEKEKTVSILNLDTLQNEAKPTHGPQQLSLPPNVQGSTPYLL